MMRRYIVPLMGVALLLMVVMGCAQEDESQQLQLYYTVSDTSIYGEAIQSEPCIPEAEGDVLLLMNALLEGPSDQNLTSPFPVGTKMLWAGWLSDGTLVINLSEEYSGLVGMELTLADYCITYTLCQMERVDQVEILVVNQGNPFRNNLTLSPDDIL